MVSDKKKQIHWRGVASIRTGMDAVPKTLASLQGCMVSPKYHAVFVPSRYTQTQKGARGM